MVVVELRRGREFREGVRVKEELSYHKYSMVFHGLSSMLSHRKLVRKFNNTRVYERILLQEAHAR